VKKSFSSGSIKAARKSRLKPLFTGYHEQKNVPDPYPHFFDACFTVGSLGLEAGFFELQTANAVEVIQNGSPEANRSPGVSPEEALEKTVEESSLVGFFSKEGFSKETLSPARKKISTDLLRLSDERYLPSGETPEAFRGRMARFGHLLFLLRNCL